MAPVKTSAMSAISIDNYFILALLLLPGAWFLIGGIKTLFLKNYYIKDSQKNVISQANFLRKNNEEKKQAVGKDLEFVRTHKYYFKYGWGFRWLFMGLLLALFSLYGFYVKIFTDAKILDGILELFGKIVKIIE